MVKLKPLPSSVAVLGSVHLELNALRPLPLASGQMQRPISSAPRDDQHPSCESFTAPGIKMKPAIFLERLPSGSIHTVGLPFRPIEHWADRIPGGQLCPSSMRRIQSCEMFIRSRPLELQH